MAPQQEPNAVDNVLPKAEVIKKEIYYDGHFYDVTDWIPKHPGGTELLNYYTELNEDATIPIQQFHHLASKQLMTKMKSLKKRPATLAHSESKRHEKLTVDFQKMFKKFEDRGLFEVSLLHTFLRFLELAVFLSLGIYFRSYEGTTYWATPLSYFFTVLYLFRCSFLMHEGCHGTLTGSPRYDRYIDGLLMNLGLGYSSTWWCSTHNRHHAMTQRVGRDVDMNTLPLIAFNSKIALESKFGNNFFTRNQAWLFLTIDTLIIAIFWKTYVHPKYVIRKRQIGQLLLMILHYAFFLSIFSLSEYTILVWLNTLFATGTIMLSHSHLSVTTENLHWVEYAFLHTTNINPSLWTDWSMGFLNYQIEHHLFPLIPHFKLRYITEEVKNYALKHDLPYKCIPYTSAIRSTLTNLSHVSEDIKNHKES